MNETENFNQDQVLALLRTAHDAALDFYNFLRSQERDFLEACEPEYVEFIRGIPGSKSEPMLLNEEANSLIKTKPQEWVRLLQETSDILSGLRHLRIVLESVNSVLETRGSVGVGEVGQKIELLFLTELDIIYRILGRLRSGLNRLRRKAAQHSSEALQSAEELLTSNNSWSERFVDVRGSMTHTVNFGADGLLEDRAWEAIAVSPLEIFPADIQVMWYEERAEDTFAIIRQVTAGTAKNLVELYPQWKALLETLTLPAASPS